MQIDMDFDVVIIGGGVSGPIIADKLSSNGKRVLILEAGKFFKSHNFLRTEIDATSQLYWGGGMELDKKAQIAMIRPKVVGGGSIINGGLLDEFDDIAFDDFRNESNISFFSKENIKPYYEEVNKTIHINKIPTKFANKNAKIFKNGLESIGKKYAVLDRGQTNCEYEKGNNCIECLSGCPINSKQSTLISFLKNALKNNTKIYSEFMVQKILKKGNEYIVNGHNRLNQILNFKCKKVVLCAGPFGNNVILNNSSYNKLIPHLGKDFYTHPQYMVLAIFNELIEAYKGPLQTYKSYDDFFRKSGFKLENVFAPPVSLSLLIPGHGQNFMSKMNQLKNMGCIEVAIRDTTPGEINVQNNRPVISKNLNSTDLARKNHGLGIIKDIFTSQNAKEIIEGQIGIGLHLMGGCKIGVNPKNSVVNEKFQLHIDKNIYIGDSSIFPNAPGINPSLTVMALAIKCAQSIIEEY